MTDDAIGTWLRPLRPVLDPLGEVDWDRLDALETELAELLANHPVDASLPAGAQRSDRLRTIRCEMAVRSLLDTPSPRYAILAQFVCGYRDIDLRDTVGLGHGQLIARHARPATRHQWIPRFAAGELAGIAITEPHGGSRPAETRTRAVPGPGRTWLVTGHKTWISRLTEAAVFVVFFQTPAGRLVAAAIDALDPRLHRTAITPTGLAGWTWGELDLDAVPVDPDQDVLLGDGMALLRQHFANYRPLVTATALGAAAAIFDTVTTGLTTRLATGEILRLRDSALITLGRTHAQLVTALLGTSAAAQFAATGANRAELWSCAMKAHGVDTAHQAAAELALLLGATTYRADSPVAKARRDLGGLLYADGIHDSLYRSAGKNHTTTRPSAIPDPRPEPQAKAVSA